MGLHYHHHHGCDHSNIRHCNTCDVTYCVSCGKEWGIRKYSFNYGSYPNNLLALGGAGGAQGTGHNHV